MNIQLKRMRDEAKTPEYGSEGAACFDFFAAAETTIKPGDTKVVPLGFAVGIQEGWEMTIRPRSGMSLKTPLRIANAPGTIDSDYRGEVGVIMTNTGQEKVIILVGDRIAQGTCQRAEKTHFTFVEQLSPSDRGSGGFGSTGT